MTHWPQRERTEIASILGNSNPDSIDKVLEMQRGLQPVLGRLSGGSPNGVAAFNRLYTVITQGVCEGLRNSYVSETADLNGELTAEGNTLTYDPYPPMLERGQSISFAEPALMECLDVKFASLYFNALRRWVSGNDGGAPKCWAILFGNWENERLSELGGAIMGVNAHVNYDLARAVVEASMAKGVGIIDGSSHHKDFITINDIFRRSLDPLKDSLEMDWLGRFVEAVFGGVADVAQLRAIIEAREIAWDEAKQMFGMTGTVLTDHLEHLDTRAELLGRLVLTIEETD